MDLSALRRRPLGWAAAVLAGGGVLTAIAAASQPPQHEDTVAFGSTPQRGCVSLDVVDRSVQAYILPKSSTGPVGTLATYSTVVNDAADKTQVGSAVGTVAVLYTRPSDRHIIEYRTEQMRLADGTIAYHDFEDRTAVALGKVMHSRVQGTSGRYAGMTGRMDWQVFGTAVGHNRVPTHIELCRRR